MSRNRNRGVVGSCLSYWLRLRYNPIYMSRQRETQQKTWPRKTWHRTRYAFHEAGHAVVGHMIGRCISEVSIVADRGRGYRGYCAFNAYAEDLQGMPQWRDGGKNPECTTIMYAGTVAMAILCEQRGWKYERWRGVDKADFDMIYLWSWRCLGKIPTGPMPCNEHARNRHGRFSSIIGTPLKLLLLC